MIPALAIIGIGRRRRIPIPIPVFLLWPLVAIALAVVFGLGILVPPRTDVGRAFRVGRIGLLSLFHLSGLRIDVESSSGENIRLRLV